MNGYCRLRWEHPEKRRYYEVYLSQDLWGDWCLQQIWGTRGTRLGQVREQLMASFEDGETAILAIAKRRSSRGYQLTDQRGTPLTGLASFFG